MNGCWEERGSESSCVYRLDGCMVLCVINWCCYFVFVVRC